MTTADVKRYIEGPMAEEYDYRAKEGTVRVARDPKVTGTYAARFEDLRDGTVDLLFITREEDGTPDEVLSRTLEEVEYERWPPRSGPLQFFT